MPASSVLPPEIKAQMNVPLTVKMETASDGFGKKTTTTRGTYYCYAVDEVTVTRDLEGRDTRTNVTLYIDSTDIVYSDLITYNGIDRHIVSLETWRDGTNAIWGQVAYVT